MQCLRAGSHARASPRGWLMTWQLASQRARSPSIRTITARSAGTLSRPWVLASRGQRAAAHDHRGHWPHPKPGRLLRLVSSPTIRRRAQPAAVRTPPMTLTQAQQAVFDHLAAPPGPATWASPPSLLCVTRHGRAGHCFWTRPEPKFRCLSRQPGEHPGCWICPASSSHRRGPERARELGFTSCPLRVR